MAKFPTIKRKKVKTLEQFYKLMSETAKVRRVIVSKILKNKQVPDTLVISLENALYSLSNIEQTNGKYLLFINKSSFLETDFIYETSELEKDVYFIKKGEEKFYGYLERLHPNFSNHLNEGVKKLAGLKFKNFLTDRDGTINNYCERYRSSVQSAYNSVFLSRFAIKKTDHSIIITSAPLKGPGILDVNVDPPKTFIYAASKAREFIDDRGKRHQYSIDKIRAKKLRELNKKLSQLIKNPDYFLFSLIGSGLQFKFGQTTIARQDISGSIPKNISADFLKLIKIIVAEIDPEKKYFVIEDTGKDIEIILTKKGDSSKDFDKADGINFLDKTLGLKFSIGPNLICGDTSSDLQMIEASSKKTDKTWAFFVTKDKDLADKANKICKKTIIVPEPDILVCILNELAKRGGK